MDNTKYVALSRQMGLWKQMDTVANNMANMNTSGYKTQEVMFKSYVAQAVGAEGFGKDPVHFTQDYATVKDFSEGVMYETGNTYDVAISGDAFFAVETDHGEMYTRKGQFQVDYSGQIVTQDGYTVLNESNEPLFIAPDERSIEITATGEVVTENGIIGRLKLVKFDDNQKLKKVTDTMYSNVENNKMDVANDVRVAQGVVEKSNVNSIAEMTKLISLQRNYEYVQQMIDAEHQRLSNTIEVYSQLA
ncbi:MAG: flagellar basal-body rod protein FlgF [Lactobacillus sp.]|nr:flagellar basal-body rod protein FlgF [Lactobacillus sp.]